jgi:hypothetical protein
MRFICPEHGRIEPYKTGYSFPMTGWCPICDAQMTDLDEKMKIMSPEEAAHLRPNYKPEKPYKLTKEEAFQVKKWRCGDGYNFNGGTWRWVARKAAEKWSEKDICPGNQFDGMGLCKEAAEMFNQDYMEKPWN